MPLCPYCNEEIVPKVMIIRAPKAQNVCEFYCPECNKILGFSPSE